MPLMIKNISHTISVNGEHGLAEGNAISNRCGGHNPRPPPCTRPRGFANYLAVVSEEHQRKIVDVLNESLRELEVAMQEAGIPIEGQALDIVQNLIVNVRSE